VANAKAGRCSTRYENEVAVPWSGKTEISDILRA
jgi:hypothetical protein